MLLATPLLLLRSEDGRSPTTRPRGVSDKPDFPPAVFRLQVAFKKSTSALPGLANEPVNININCADGVEVPMIGAHELLDPAIQELRYNWIYLAPDGTQGPSPFHVPPAPGMSLPSPLTEEQAGVLTPGTNHTWLFRAIVSRPGLMVRMTAVLVGSQKSACMSNCMVSLAWHGMAWHGMAWHGMVWYGMVWYGMVWYGMVWYGMVWYGMVWYGMVWYGMVWYGMVWYGMVWYGMVWYGMVWYGMVWYGMVWYGIWYGMVWYGMVWYGMVWYGMVWYGMVWYGMVLIVL